MARAQVALSHFEAPVTHSKDCLVYPDSWQKILVQLLLGLVGHMPEASYSRFSGLFLLID